jgi:hypothetical protein
MTGIEPPFISGELRHWTPPSRRDPHTVLRVDALNDQVLIRYTDRTTAWEPIGWYRAQTDAGDLPRVRSYDRDGEPHDDVLRTKSGKIITDDDIDRWAEEADRG